MGSGRAQASPFDLSPRMLELAAITVWITASPPKPPAAKRFGG
jgi:hypothetical protein